MTTASLEWAHSRQAETLEHAEAWGEAWTKDDIEFVEAFTDEATDEEIALALGRTLYAVWGMQHRLANNELTPGERCVRHGVLWERTYTFIGDDVPPGWND